MSGAGLPQQGPGAPLSGFLHGGRGTRLWGLLSGPGEGVPAAGEGQAPVPGSLVRCSHRLPETSFPLSVPRPSPPRPTAHGHFPGAPRAKGQWSKCPGPGKQPWRCPAAPDCGPRPACARATAAATAPQPRRLPLPPLRPRPSASVPQWPGSRRAHGRLPTGPPGSSLQRTSCWTWDLGLPPPALPRQLRALLGCTVFLNGLPGGRAPPYAPPPGLSRPPLPPASAHPQVPSRCGSFSVAPGFSVGQSRWWSEWMVLERQKGRVAGVGTGELLPPRSHVALPPSREQVLLSCFHG